MHTQKKTSSNRNPSYYIEYDGKLKVSYVQMECRWINMTVCNGKLWERANNQAACEKSNKDNDDVKETQRESVRKRVQKTKIQYKICHRKMMRRTFDCFMASTLYPIKVEK